MYSQELYFLYMLETGYGAYPSSYSVGTQSFSPGIRWPGCEADHPPPTDAKVKKMCQLGFVLN
jgi:hypothetical protein